MTVDVSSASHQARAPKKKSAQNVADTVPVENIGQTGNQDEKTVTNDQALQDNNLADNGDKTASSASTNPESRIQILDLHTENPLISYNNRIYTCTWGSTLGTDIFLTSPTALSTLQANHSITPLKTLSEAAILGTSCVKLTARPVTITPKTDNPRPSTQFQAPSANIQAAPILPTTNGEAAPYQPSPPPSSSTSQQMPPPNPLKIPLNASAPNSTRKQASFLESLMAIKAAKGESDQVTVHALKSYQGYGWRSRRRLEEAAEALDLGENESNDDDVQHEGADSIPRTEDVMGNGAAREEMPSPAKRARTRARGQRGSPRRIGRPRRSKARIADRTGGLFGDYMPDDEEEARSNAAQAGKTPGRWEDVEREVLGTPEGGSGREGEGLGTATGGNAEEARGNEEGEAADIVMVER